LTPREKNLAITGLLQTIIETKVFQEKLKLRQVLEVFGDKFGGKLAILVDTEAFLVGQDRDKTPDLYEEEVSLPYHPIKMTLSTALRLILSQVGKGEATYIIRQGYIEITTLKASSAAHLLRQPIVLASFDNRPLQEVLDQFSAESGLAIHLDPNVGKKGQTAIKAMFNNTSLEGALVTVTEMAELKYVALERAIYVTTAEKAAIMRKEEQKRALERKDALPKGALPKAKRIESAP